MVFYRIQAFKTQNISANGCKTIKFYCKPYALSTIFWCAGVSKYALYIPNLPLDKNGPSKGGGVRVPGF